MIPWGPRETNHVCDVRNESVQLQSLVLTVSLLRVCADSWLSMPGIPLLSNTFCINTHLYVYTFLGCWRIAAHCA